MKFADLKEFIQIAKEAGATWLEYEMKDKKFSIGLGGMTKASHLGGQVGGVTTDRDGGSASGRAGPSEDGDVVITSPFVGTFYHSSAPGADPYVKEGDQIGPGQVLCIIEAMKIMNEIESEISGKVVEICADNETYVEFGQPLFKVRP